MARVTVEDCLTVVDNRFDLVLLAAKRARALADPKNKEEPLINPGNDKYTVIALREIAAQLIPSDYQPPPSPEKKRSGAYQKVG